MSGSTWPAPRVAAEGSRMRATLLKGAFRLSSPGGRRGRLSVLIYHRVRERRDPLFPREATADLFRARMAFLRDFCNVVPLDEAVRALARGALPERAVAITFDDGYADNARVALPILRDLGVPATFFVATGFLDGGRMWNDTIIEAVRGAPGANLDLLPLGLGTHALGGHEQRRAAIDALIGAVKHRPADERARLVAAIAAMADARLPDDLMMTADEVRALAAAGMGIGGHTATHPILARLDFAAARREIAEGREALAGIVQQRIGLFAYPNGKPGDDYSREHVDLVRSLGFDAAVSTSPGAARAGEDPYELPRFTPWDTEPLAFGARMIANVYSRRARVA